ncbi:ABC transporter permease [Luteipulveratus sp. YIM 133132]|uniref:ABC transporter permease n=1 Tax=Luteipulveratus flavus TaxID=3031728 RepID=UPI0023B163D7|nr:ABC transporter permease [Luteipulveratus sp. YIM 133132]MDE9366993.1 ABC transporter permease [Luteipulveratus sp. YIM 133132]
METTRLAGIWSQRKVLDTLVRRDLRVRYARSWLGYVWTLIDPLAMGLVYFFVFGVLFGRTTGSDDLVFIVYLLAGMLPWNWFNNSINETARALYAERLLVRSTNIAREMWVIRVVIAKGIEFLLSLPVLVLFVVLILFGVDLGHGNLSLNERLIAIVPALLLQFVLCVGMGLVMAPVTALVDDFVRIVRIVLRMLFYFTPIVYSMELVDDKLPWARDLMVWNPLVGIMDMWRVGLSGKVGVDGWAWITATIVSFAWLAFGLWVFRKLEPAVLKEI